jgi:AcrR family transcriptional regulator
MRIGEKLKTEDALLRAAESLLERGGPDAVTTRAVCDAANVGAPTLYHHYGDKNGLLDALVAKGVKAFLKRKQTAADTADALADLISGWESFIGFALERPQLFRLMVQRVGDNPQILDAALARTDARLIRLASEGRLTTDVQFARRSLLALSNGVTALWTQGASKAEVEAVGRFLLNATLSALVRTKRP